MDVETFSKAIRCCSQLSSVRVVIALLCAIIVSRYGARAGLFRESFCNEARKPVASVASCPAALVTSAVFVATSAFLRAKYLFTTSISFPVPGSPNLLSGGATGIVLAVVWPFCSELLPQLLSQEPRDK